MGVEALVLQGMVFTGVAEREREKEDLVVKAISNYTGYIKENSRVGIEVYPDLYYRFKVVAGPFRKRMHNYYLCVAVREIYEDEGAGLNVVYPD